MHSTIQRQADGSTLRWNAAVGKWQQSQAQMPAPAGQAAPTTAATDTAARAAAPAGPFMPARHALAARMYGAARNTRTTGGFGSSGSSSADAELSTSLATLRARSRQMVRDSAYAKRARTIIVNNVIGAGVGMQAQVLTTRGTMAEAVNSGIEDAWADWCRADACHTGGALHFSDLERAAMGQVFEAGEVFIRLHYVAMGTSRVPLALELIEPERLGHDLIDPGTYTPGAEVRMGVEVDAFGRALAYWVRQRHPGDIRAQAGATDRYERVPAQDMYHLRIVDRWPQTRGEPWLHAVLRKIDDMNEYTGLEVTAARGSAAYFATIESPEDAPLANAQDDTGNGGMQPVMEIDPLTVQALAPGEKLTFHAPNRPNAALDPFMRAMLREVAAGCGPSYESLSRDYSQSNYSSSRLALLDDRDLYKVLQQWWVRAFRRPLHAVWLQQAVLAGAVQGVPAGQYAAAPEKYAAALFKPRGWSWVDPTKEVNAYKEAIRAGITTLSDVIAQTQGGQDIEDIVKTRQRELQMLADAGIEVDTTVPDPQAAVAPAMPEGAMPHDYPAAPGRVMPLRRGA